MKKRARAAEDETLQAYLREISTFPSLTPEEEQQLGHRICRNRDQHAFRRLVESNLRFVAGYARKYRGMGVVLLDLIDEANLGLLEAARRFDPERNGRFAAYAQWWVRQAIMHALAEQGRVFAVPRKWWPMLPRGLRRRHLSPAHRTTAEQPPAFPGAERAAWLFKDASVRRAVAGQLHEVLGDLSANEREIVQLRFGLDGNASMNIQQVALRLGVSRERVRRLESSARQKIRRSQKSREILSSLN